MPTNPETGPAQTGISRAANPVLQSDSLHFFQYGLQQHADTSSSECKKDLKILHFLTFRRDCIILLLRIMKNCSIMLRNHAGILGRLKTPAHSIIRMRSTATRPRPASSAPHGPHKHDDGFFHKYQDMVMSLDQSRVIHAV